MKRSTRDSFPRCYYCGNESGKLGTPHKCPHGRTCVGARDGKPLCPKCRAFLARQLKLKGFA